MADEYNLADAFRRIEEELIASMIRNMKLHRAEETEMGFQWAAWQAEQLKALERYRRANQKKYSAQFEELNRQIEELIYQARVTGRMNQEIQILRGIPLPKHAPEDA